MWFVFMGLGPKSQTLGTTWPMCFSVLFHVWVLVATRGVGCHFGICDFYEMFWCGEYIINVMIRWNTCMCYEVRLKGLWISIRGEEGVVAANPID